jgi:hypothetical protein
MKSSVMCGLMFQSLGCRIPHKDILGSEFDWNVDALRKPGHVNSNGVPRPEINVLPSTDYRNPKTGGSDKKVMKVVHLTDLHIDYDYKEGIN